MADRGRRVLITGIANPVSCRLASRLEADEGVEYVAGVDLVEPEAPLERTEFIRADLRSPLVAKVIESTRVDTLVHLGITTTPGQVGGRSRMKELNVIGSMQLLAAAQKAPRLRNVVVRSTTAVYGSHYRNPSLINEDVATDAPPRSGYAKDATEVETYARRLSRRRPDLTMTILRLANTVGPTVDTPLTKYFALPVVPTVLGYDPRLQLLHEDDAVGALERAAVDPHPGIYNVAGPGVIYLSQAIRIAGKVAVPLARPLMPWLAGMLRQSGRVDFAADQLGFLLYGRVGDITRLRERFGYEPRYSTREALEAFLEAQGIERAIDPEAVATAEHELLGALRRLGPAGGAVAAERANRPGTADPSSAEQEVRP